MHSFGYPATLFSYEWRGNSRVCLTHNLITCMSNSEGAGARPFLEGARAKSWEPIAWGKKGRISNTGYHNARPTKHHV